jgi:hypothetical protein
LEDAQGESQSTQQKLVASATQSASRPNPTQYVGTPAIGTSRAAAAAGVPSVGPTNTVTERRRRRSVWSCVAAFLAAWFIAFFRFFLPRVLFEPATVFKGYSADYALGIDEKYLQKYRIWVDRTPGRLFVIYARCTHLGALEIGSQRRTNSSSRATAAATTTRELAWKIRRRDRWTVPSSSWPRTAGLSSPPVMSTRAPKAKKLISMLPLLGCFAPSRLASRSVGASRSVANAEPD